MLMRYYVRDWMTPNPITVGPKTKLPDAHRLMVERHIRRLPIMENGRLVGILTMGDVREAGPSNAVALSIFELNYLLAMLSVDKIMTHDVITVTPDTPLAEAAKLMLEYKISGLPVIENKQLVGIITESDIFRVIVEEWLPAMADEPTPFESLAKQHGA